MNNLCLLGMGLAGLLFLSKDRHEETSLKKITSKTSHIKYSDKQTTAESFANSQYLTTHSTDVEWIVPENELDESKLHMFVGFDYMKINLNNDVVSVGRYIEVSNKFKNIMNILEPKLEFNNTVTLNNKKYRIYLLFSSISVDSRYMEKNILMPHAFVLQKTKSYTQLKPVVSV